MKKGSDAGNQTFVKITNNHIYEKLLIIEKKQDQTNGKVKLVKWIATTALTLVISVVFFIIANH